MKKQYSLNIDIQCIYTIKCVHVFVCIQVKLCNQWIHVLPGCCYCMPLHVSLLARLTHCRSDTARAINIIISTHLNTTITSNYYMYMYMCVCVSYGHGNDSWFLFLPIHPQWSIEPLLHHAIGSGLGRPSPVVTMSC